jgi:ribosome-associated heat shock protein Hsp15
MLYRETDESRELRVRQTEERKAMPQFEASRQGRPSKRDRRELGRLRDRS